MLKYRLSFSVFLNSVLRPYSYEDNPADLQDDKESKKTEKTGSKKDK